MTEVETLPRNRRRWPRWLAGIVLVATLGGVFADFVVFQEREKRISAVVAQLRGKGISKGAWPIGVEHAVVFVRSLTTDELQELAKLRSIHQSGRHSILVFFNNHRYSKTEMNEILATLHDMHVEFHEGIFKELNDGY
jgi:hypothetical protein